MCETTNRKRTIIKEQLELVGFIEYYIESRYAHIQTYQLSYQQTVDNSVDKLCGREKTWG